MLDWASGNKIYYKHENVSCLMLLSNDSIICYGSFDFFVWKCNSAPKKAYAADGMCCGPFHESWQQENASQNTKCQAEISPIKVIKATHK